MKLIYQSDIIISVIKNRVQIHKDRMGTQTSNFSVLGFLRQEKINNITKKINKHSE